MAQTKAQIATLALRRLGVIPEEQSPTAWQQTTAESGVTRSHEELAHHGIAHWDIAATPDAVATAFADYVAGDIALTYMEEERAVYFQSRMVGAMRRMAAVTAKRDFSDAPVKITDF